MTITDRTTIKSWFKTKLKPTQAQFWAWMDSFWHKNESIPTASISGLDDLVSMMVTLEKVTAVKKELEALIAGKVDKVDGKRLSTEDFTTELKNKLDVIDMSEKLDAGDYDGSGEDLYNAIQEILTVLASDDTTLDELQEIVNYIKQNKSTLDRLGISNIAGLTAALAAKVDTVAGKGLSTEDFTTALKTKLEGIDDILSDKIDKNGRIIVPEGNVIDMSAGEIFIKTLHEDTVLTVTNPLIGKEILLIVDGNYNLTLPGLVMDGSLYYNGFAKNYITIKCISVAPDQYAVYRIDRDKEETAKDSIDFVFDSGSENYIRLYTSNFNDVYVSTSNFKTKTGGGDIFLGSYSNDEICHVYSDKGAIALFYDLNQNSVSSIKIKEIKLNAINLKTLNLYYFNTDISKINGSSTTAEFSSTPNLTNLSLCFSDTFTTIDLSDLTKLEKFGYSNHSYIRGDPEIILPPSVPENVRYRFSGGNLSETHVNSILEFADSNWNIPSGEKYMYIWGTAPTGEGLTAKDSLIAKGWTITTPEPDTTTTTTT